MAIESKWFVTALSAVGLGALLKLLSPASSRKKSETLLELQISAYLNYIDSRVVSNDLLILADAPVIQAIILAGPPGNAPVSLSVIDAIRQSCGTDLLSDKFDSVLKHNSRINPEDLRHGQTINAAQ